MNTIPNKWLEKVRKKRGHETAPSYASDSTDSFAYSEKKTSERHCPASRATMSRTLRGVRK